MVTYFALFTHVTCTNNESGSKLVNKIKCITLKHLHPHHLFQPLAMFTTCNIKVLIVLHCHPFKCRHLSQSLSPTNKKDHCRLPSFVEIIVSNAYVHVLIHFHTIQRLYFIQNILYKPLYFFLVSLGELVPKLVP